MVTDNTDYEVRERIMVGSRVRLYNRTPPTRTVVEIIVDNYGVFKTGIDQDVWCRLDDGSIFAHYHLVLADD